MPTGAVPPLSPCPTNASFGSDIKFSTSKAKTSYPLVPGSIGKCVFLPRAATQRYRPSAVSTARTGEHPEAIILMIEACPAPCIAMSTSITASRPFLVNDPAPFDSLSQKLFPVEQPGQRTSPFGVFATLVGSRYLFPVSGLIPSADPSHVI